MVFSQPKPDEGLVLLKLSKQQRGILLSWLDLQLRMDGLVASYSEELQDIHRQLTGFTLNPARRPRWSP